MKGINKIKTLGFVSRTRESRSVFELAELQHALAVFAVEDVWCCDVVQGVVLQGWGSWVKLGVEGQRVGGAVSRRGADGANSLCSGLHGYGRTFVETVLLGPEKPNTALILKSKREFMYISTVI